MEKNHCHNEHKIIDTLFTVCGYEKCFFGFFLIVDIQNIGVSSNQNNWVWVQLYADDSFVIVRLLI